MGMYVINEGVNGFLTKTDGRRFEEFRPFTTRKVNCFLKEEFKFQVMIDNEKYLMFQIRNADRIPGKNIDWILVIREKDAQYG
jgi:hypothetical protein